MLLWFLLMWLQSEMYDFVKWRIIIYAKCGETEIRLFSAYPYIFSAYYGTLVDISQIKQAEKNQYVGGRTWH